MNVMQQSVMNGLNSDSYQVLTAGIYSIKASSTVNFGSGLVITLSQTGSTSNSITTPPTSSQEIAVDINQKFNCAVGDILTVAVTSSAPADQAPSLVKTEINLRQGL